MTKAAIALGSNLGDRPAHLDGAIAGLESLGKVVGRSSVYETAPVGGPEQGPYLNAVVVLDTELAAPALLEAMLAIERAAGRVRDVRWGPRTIDLDLIVYGDEQIDLPGLTVPHPRAAERRFVLEPLAEVWPDARLRGGVAAANALASCQDQEVKVFRARTGRGESWVVAQAIVIGLIGVGLVTGGGGLRGWGWPGAILTIAGAALVAWAVLTLGSNLTPYPEPRTDGRLVGGGPYRLVRHPIYGGLLLGLAGLALWVGSWLSLVLVVGLVGIFWAKSAEEERRLSARFPEYDDYRAVVRRRFIPWLI